MATEKSGAIELVDGLSTCSISHPFGLQKGYITKKEKDSWVIDSSMTAQLLPSKHVQLTEEFFHLFSMW